MDRWWIEWPGRLEHEFSELEALGHHFTVNEYESAGQVEVTIEYTPAADSGRPCTLVARYPNQYPFFPVELWCRDLELGRHQDPIDGHLCTLHDPGTNWTVKDTLAGIIREQVPRVLRIAADPKGTFADQHEFHQGEPLSSYVPAQPGSSFATGTFNIPPKSSKGSVRYNLTSEQPVRGTLLEFTDKQTSESFQPEHWISERLAGRPEQQFIGKWRRTSGPISVKDPREIFEAVYGKRITDLVPSNKPRLAVAIFNEEHEWRKNGLGMLLVFLPPTKNRPRSMQAQPVFVRGERCGEAELLARIPELKELRNKHVLLVGLGMLGSPIAIQLARAGVGKLTLVDQDVVDGSTIVRWALGWQTAGLSKALVLSSHIGQQYPYVSAAGISMKIGAPMRNETERQVHDVFNNALENADLVLDATAEGTISNYLAYECRKLGKQHVFVTTTPGAYGGIVGRTLWPTTGCYSCFKHWQYEADTGNNKEDRFSSPPAAGDAAGVQPAGCRLPTVTGNGFDTDIVSLTAVRYAISALSDEGKGGYPKFLSDGVIISLRSDDGHQPISNFREFTLAKHSACYCAKG